MTTATEPRHHENSSRKASRDDRRRKEKGIWGESASWEVGRERTSTNANIVRLQACTQRSRRRHGALAASLVLQPSHWCSPSFCWLGRLCSPFWFCQLPQGCCQPSHRCSSSSVCQPRQWSPSLVCQRCRWYSAVFLPIVLRSNLSFSPPM